MIFVPFLLLLKSLEISSNVLISGQLLDGIQFRTPILLVVLFNRKVLVSEFFIIMMLDVRKSGFDILDDCILLVICNFKHFLKLILSTF